PSTAPPFGSLTRTARMEPLTGPQTATSCAMTLPSTWAPSPMRRSEARSSPLMRPKTCAGPLHSMLPTIAIPEPMQELGPVFVVGCRVGGGSSTVVGCRLGGGASTTRGFCFNAPSPASGACAARSLTFFRPFLFDMSISVFLKDSLRKGKGRLPAIEREPRQSLLLPRREDPQVRTLENRTAQSRMPPRWSYALRAIPRTAPCREFRFLTIWVSVPVLLLLCEEKLRQLCAAGRTLLKKSSSVVFRSQNGAQPGGA